MNHGMEIVWLSIGAIIMGLSLLFFALEYRRMSKRHAEEEKENKDEIQNQNNIMFVVFVVFLAFISYLLMLFASLYSTEENVTLIRYVEWFITTPLLLLDLALIAQLKFRTIYLMIFLDLLMIILGLAAVYSSNLYLKYTLFILSTGAMIALFYILFNPKHKSPHLDEKTLKKSNDANIYTTVLWSLYPLVWIMSNQGLEIFSTSHATLAYMILDVLAKAAFGFLLIM